MSEQYDILASQDADFGDDGFYNNMDDMDWQNEVQNSWTNPSYSYTGDEWSNMGTPENTWGAGGYQVGADNTQFWQNQAGDYVGYQEPGGKFTPYEQEGWTLGGISDTLASIFNSQGGQTGMKLLAALAEGSQNRKQANNLQKIAQQQTARLDPFASQRPFYQQQLQATVQDPYSQPMVKSQVDQLARAQAIKDAAAGRRSNTATSAPALIAAQAQVAQQYMNSLMNPAGANINPSGAASMNSMLTDAAKYDTNGYLSPLASALGFGQQQNSNQALLDLFKQAISQKQGA